MVVVIVVPSTRAWVLNDCMTIFRWKYSHKSRVTGDRAAELGIDLMLTGHTHGDQVSLEFVHRCLSLARIATPYVSGWFEKTGSQLYVNRGIGTTGPPIRFGAPPAIQWTAGPANAWLIEQCEIEGAPSNPNNIFLQKGDSGALLLDNNSPTALGLLWAQYMGGLRGFASAIRNVESQLQVNTAWI